MFSCTNHRYVSQEQNRVNKEINEQLKEEKRQRKRENVANQATVLVLGDKGSGKTTLIKLIHIALRHDELERHRRPGRLDEEISKEPFSEEQKKRYVKLVYKNVLEAIKELVLAMKKLSIQYENPANEEVCQQFASIDPSGLITELSSDHFSLIKQLWSDNGVCKQCYGRREEFDLPESAKYFLDALDRISSKWYSPTTEDIMRVYECTINNNSHNVMGCIHMEIVNQSLERPNKWICWLNRIYSIWFMVDVSKYDLALQSQTTGIINYLESNKLVFQKLCQIHMRSSVVLCFTKKDIFDEKISRSHLADHFPAYEGPRHDSEAAIKFITDMFEKSAIDMRSANDEFRKTIYYIAISTIDSDSSMQQVCNIWRDNIQRFHLIEYELL